MINTLDDLDYINTFVTLTSSEGFSNILEEFTNEVLKTLDLETVSIERAFDTKIVLNLEGYNEDILEACSLITFILLTYGISSFGITLHTVEECED